MITRDFGNGFQVADWTQEINFIPNQWGTINSLGIFSDNPVAEHVVVFEEITRDGALIVDRVRGDRSNQSKDFTRKLHTFAVPHFPLDDAIYPQDIQGQRAYGSPDAAETLAAVRMRKMERIRQNHAWTLEFARAQALTLGTAYSPSGTVSMNWFTEFGVTQTVVNFAFTSSTTDMIGVIETAIVAVQDNAGSVSMDGIVALCSQEFFAALISHPSIKTAYQYYQSTSEPLRTRQSAGGSSAVYRREFYHGGVKFIEMRDQYAGSRLIPASTAVFVPTGTDFFRTYFSPANRFGFVNTLGEQAYMFETVAPNGTAITIESESNHISGLLKPQVVVKATMS